MLIDIRAREITQLRENTRRLAAMLADIEQTARTNDRILLTLHKLSLLLITKPANWQPQVVDLLKKQFSLPHCQLLVFTRQTDALAKTAARLPIGGKAANTALAGTDAYSGVKRYFYLPLKKGRRTRGLLILASKKTSDFPDEAARDFSRRLAELLAAAL